MLKPTDFAYHLTTYLTTYLSGRRNFSKNTVKSYRDTFKLLIRYCNEKRGLIPEKITLKHLDKDMVNDFLRYLEEEKHVGVCTVNQRLSAIHAFCRYLEVEEPTLIFQYQRILAIPHKKYIGPQIGYLSKEALTAFFDSVDTSSRRGRRDLTLLCILYDTAARVQELCDLCVSDLSLSGAPYVSLTGKGGKTRSVPLLSNSCTMLEQYLSEFHKNTLASDTVPVFYNSKHEKLSRSSINHMINKYADIARKHSPQVPEKVTPHMFRHTKAMHLCQAGVEMVYIRDILGHSLIETTNIYARINAEQLRDALERAYPELPAASMPDWTSNGSLMQFLDSL